MKHFRTTSQTARAVPFKSVAKASALALAVGLTAITFGSIVRAADHDGGGSLVHGADFQVRTLVDESFCIETDVAMSTPAPHVHLAKCTGAQGQRWTFTDGADGSSVVVNDLGFCLTVESGPEPRMLTVESCDYHSEQRFTVSAAGQLMPQHTDDCLTVSASVVPGNPIFVAECQNSMVRERLWRFAQ